MNIMGRRMLRLVGIGAIALAIPELASAMGPMSAAQKNQGQPAVSDTNSANCNPSEGTCPKPKPHHRSRKLHRRSGKRYP